MTAALLPFVVSFGSILLMLTATMALAASSGRRPTTRTTPRRPIVTRSWHHNPQVISQRTTARHLGGAS